MVFSLQKWYYIIQSSATFFLKINSIKIHPCGWFTNIVHFLWLYNILLCEYTIIYLSILLSIDICITSNFLPFWIILKHFLVHMCDSFSMVRNYIQNYMLYNVHIFRGKCIIVFQYCPYQFTCFSPVMCKIWYFHKILFLSHFISFLLVFIHLSTYKMINKHHILFISYSYGLHQYLIYLKNDK